MNYLNYEFFDEFKALDNLCRDVYGKSADNKLGVTMYIDAMDKAASMGAHTVPEWSSDYRMLKRVRHIRNELAHSRSSFSSIECTREDVEFVRSFKERMLSSTDPISVLRKQIAARRQVTRSTPYRHARSSGMGCLVYIVALLAIAACIIAFLF